MVVYLRVLSQTSVPSGNFAGAGSCRRTNSRTRFLPVEEAKGLIEAASRHIRPFLICALETGMRREKILSLKWENVDMTNEKGLREPIPQPLP
ncbi:MAG: hypothetical protein ACWGPR_00625 [Candidatus Deferrimicrobiaceae bacterium]